MRALLPSGRNPIIRFTGQVLNAIPLPGKGTRNVGDSGGQGSIKNHIYSQAPTIFNKLESAYGVSYQDFVDACNGNAEKRKKLGEFGRQGEKLAYAAPKLTEAYIKGVKGTVALNEGLGKIAREAGSGNQKINKAYHEAGLIETKTNNILDEQNKSAANKYTVEALRHNYELTKIETEHKINKDTVGVDREHQIATLESRPLRQNLALEAQYEQQQLDYYLEHGANADMSLLPEKKYGDSRGLFAKMKTLILG